MRPLKQGAKRACTVHSSRGYRPACHLDGGLLWSGCLLFPFVNCCYMFLVCVSCLLRIPCNMNNRLIALHFHSLQQIHEDKPENTRVEMGGLLGTHVTVKPGWGQTGAQLFCRRSVVHRKAGLVGVCYDARYRHKTDTQQEAIRRRPLSLSLCHRRKR